MREHRGRLIFLDETSTNTKMTKATGRCLKGERLFAKAPFGHWGTQTLIAGLKCHGLVAPWVINAPMNRVIFDTYVETQLAPSSSEVMSSSSIIWLPTKVSGLKTSVWTYPEKVEGLLIA